MVTEIAWPMALPTQIGIIIASLSQALQCLISVNLNPQSRASNKALL